jgi:hypothetical protein
MNATSGVALDGAITKARTRLLPFLVLMYVLAFHEPSTFRLFKMP